MYSVVTDRAGRKVDLSRSRRNEEPPQVTPWCHQPPVTDPLKPGARTETWAGANTPGWRRHAEWGENQGRGQGEYPNLQDRGQGSQRCWAATHPPVSPLHDECTCFADKLCCLLLTWLLSLDWILSFRKTRTKENHRFRWQHILIFWSSNLTGHDVFLFA